MKKAHFIAVGGKSMSGIAKILIDQGFFVSGSDIDIGGSAQRLSGLGALISLGHRKENIQDPDFVVVSSAIADDNPEVQEAKRRGIPVVHRMDMLLEIITGKKIIGVAGAHGKTSTSAMIAWVLDRAGADPTFFVAGEFGKEGSARLGNGEYAVVETDESDGSFLKCSPDINVVTNIDNDHLDFWGSFDSLKQAFYSYLSNTKLASPRIVCVDNEYLFDWAKANPENTVSYAISHEADWQVVDITDKGWGISCRVLHGGEPVAEMRLNVPGYYNIQNALAAVASSFYAGISPQESCAHLSEFPGVERRLQRIGEYGGVLVLDDFAHHPREITAVLGAIRRSMPNARIIALFQPHRYSRTRLLFNEFGAAFGEADTVIVTGIYTGPGEKKDSYIGSGSISNSIQESGHRSVFKIDDMDEASSFAARLCHRGDVVVTLGAGDIWKSHKALSQLLAAVQ